MYYSNRPQRRGARRNSGGIMCLVRNSLAKWITPMNFICDDIMWLQFDNTHFRNNKPICIGVVYISPEGSSIHETRNLDIHMELERQITVLLSQGYACYIIGDFNGRTGQALDYIVMDNASEYLPLDVDYNVDNQYDVPPRTNQDNVTNNYGRQLLDICKVTGVRIINGRYHNDAHIGRFTCHTANDGHSTVDYLLARPDDIPLVRDFCVEDMSVVSRDHCPLTFTLTVHCSNQPERTSISTADYRYVWSRDKLTIYRDNLMSDNIVQSLGNIHNVLGNVVPDVNAAVNILVTNIESAATPCRRVTRRESDRKATVDRPRWWNDECYHKKMEFQRLGHLQDRQNSG